MKLDIPAEIVNASRPPAMRTKVVASFSGYTPPFDVAQVVEKMLASVPPKFLVGLSEVVLTNTAGLPRRVRRSVSKSRKRKVRIVEAGGLYHPAWNGKTAWIEIFVDNMLRVWERSWWLRLRFLREGLVGDVLFHEIGHHIHYSVQPEYREEEDVADVWKVRLSRHYTRTAYPLFGAIARMLNSLMAPVLNILIKRSARMELEKGWISRAEFEERKTKSREL